MISKKATAILIAFTVMLTTTSTIAQADSATDDESNDGYAIYGNWCGPKHPRNTATAAEPVDSLDSACKTHDICYEQKGDMDCGCDAALVKEIRQGIDRGMYATIQYQYARSIHNYFQGSPCNGDSKDKLLPSRLLHKAYERVKEGIDTIVDVVSDYQDDGQDATISSESSEVKTQ